MLAKIYSLLPELSRVEVRKLYDTFSKNVREGERINMWDLRLLMEKLGVPQTHVELKRLFNEMEKDGDGKIGLYEFVLIYRKVWRSGQLARPTEIDVGEVGVRGAIDFFESQIEQQLSSNKFQEEIRQEQEERRRMEKKCRQLKQRASAAEKRDE